MALPAAQDLPPPLSAGPARHNRRVLIVDDNVAIHDDIRKILDAAGEDQDALDDAEAAFLGAPRSRRAESSFQIDSAAQGGEALALVRRARATGSPYAMAFVDMRMPPGWDGLETIHHLWQEDP